MSEDFPWTPDARLLDRASTAQRVAEVLRERITAGDLAPGTRLAEEQLNAALGVSRNTLREAFRLLTHEGLLEHQLHRGVFVRALSEDDLVDLYRLRRIIECSVVAALDVVPKEALAALEQHVRDAQAAAEKDDWGAVGTANMRFHADLVGLAGSPRTDQVVAHLLAEVRLAFHAVDSPQRLHQPYVARNKKLLRLVARKKYDEAAAELGDYLDASLAELLAAMRESER